MRLARLGPLLLCSSLLWYLHPSWPVGIGTYYAFEATFSLGLLLTYELLIMAWGGSPLSASRALRLYLLGLGAGIFLELFSNWLFKTWVYPPLSNRQYVANIFLFHGLYFMVLVESYRAALQGIRRYVPARQEPRYTRREKRLLPILGWVGAIALITLCLTQATSLQLNRPWWKTLNASWDHPVPLAVLLGMCLAVWMLVEGLSYQRRAGSFLLSLRHGRLAPLVAILIASAVTSLLYELYNLPLHLWQYINLPYQSILFLGVPAVALLLWPVQYVYFLSLDHLLNPKETTDLWA